MLPAIWTLYSSFATIFVRDMAGTHLTDYVAQFSALGANFLATVNYIDDITLEDLLAALPALIFFAVIDGIFAYAMVTSYGNYREEKKKRILKELNDPATAVLFQLALQEENIARYLIHQAMHKNHNLVKALVTHEEIFDALYLYDGVFSEEKAEQVRLLFHAIDDSGDKELSVTELYRFIRFMNPSHK